MRTSMNRSGRTDHGCHTDRGTTAGTTAGTAAGPSTAELEMGVLLTICSTTHTGAADPADPACVFVLSRRLAAWAHSDVAELGPGWDKTSPIRAALQTIPGTGTTVRVLGAWPVDSRLCALARAGAQHVTDEVRRYPSYEAAHAAHPDITEHVVGLALPECEQALPRLSRSLQRRLEASGRTLLA